MSGADKTRGGGKLRERVAALEEHVTSLGSQVESLASRAGTNYDDEIAQLREIGEMAAKSIAELRVELEGKLAAMSNDIAEIRKAGGVTASRPRPLVAEEAERLMLEEPSRRWISLIVHRDLGLRPGETFDPRAKFGSPRAAAQHVHAGLKVCAAPQ